MDAFALKHLSQLVYQYCGLNYQKNLPSLAMKVSVRIEQLSLSLWGYIQILEKDRNEWDKLTELLTINETYFFREDKQLTFFKKNMLPNFRNVSQHQPLRIWSAACSTGEEPYSLAMLILDSGLFKPNEVRIIGTDINKKVLSTAKKGIYSKRSLSFRRIPQEWLGKYFVETEQDYQISDMVKSMVSFEYLNLLDGWQMSSKNQINIIFCRNVLIYFDQETTKKVASSFYQALVDGGHLFLGHAETISNMGIGFETLNTEGTFYYRKGIQNGTNIWSVGR